jgi:hypothetical protein
MSLDDRARPKLRKEFSAAVFSLWRLSNMAAPYRRKFLLRRSVTMTGWRNVKSGGFAGRR